MVAKGELLDRRLHEDAVRHYKHVLIPPFQHALQKPGNPVVQLRHLLSVVGRPQLVLRERRWPTTKIINNLVRA